MTARSEVDRWNMLYPIGQPVRYWRGVRAGEGQVGNTRSHAWEMCETAVVLITGATGGIALSHVEALEMPALTPEEELQCRDFAEILQDWPPCQLTLDAGAALMLIGNLQLACRHPLNIGTSGQFARQLVDDLGSQLPPECLELIERGWQREHDSVAVACPIDATAQVHSTVDPDERWELTKASSTAGGGQCGS